VHTAKKIRSNSEQKIRKSNLRRNDDNSRSRGRNRSITPNQRYIVGDIRRERSYRNIERNEKSCHVRRSKSRGRSRSDHRSLSSGTSGRKDSNTYNRSRRSNSLQREESYRNQSIIRHREHRGESVSRKLGGRSYSSQSRNGRDALLRKEDVLRNNHEGRYAHSSSFLLQSGLDRENFSRSRSGQVFKNSRLEYQYADSNNIYQGNDPYISKDLSPKYDAYSMSSESSADSTHAVDSEIAMNDIEEVSVGKFNYAAKLRKWLNIRVKNPERQVSKEEYAPPVNRLDYALQSLENFKTTREYDEGYSNSYPAEISHQGMHQSYYAEVPEYTTMHNLPNNDAPEVTTVSSSGESSDDFCQPHVKRMSSSLRTVTENSFKSQKNIQPRALINKCDNYDNDPKALLNALCIREGIVVKKRIQKSASIKPEEKTAMPRSILKRVGSTPNSISQRQVNTGSSKSHTLVDNSLYSEGNKAMPRSILKRVVSTPATYNGPQKMKYDVNKSNEELKEMLYLEEVGGTKSCLKRALKSTEIVKPKLKPGIARKNEELQELTFTANAGVSGSCLKRSSSYPKVEGNTEVEKMLSAVEALLNNVKSNREKKKKPKPIGRCKEKKKKREESTIHGIETVFSTSMDRSTDSMISE